MTGQEQPSTNIRGTGTTSVDGQARQATLTVNGAPAILPAAEQLLTALRDRLGLTGAKPGCGEGSCGACTVLLDGQPARSCQLTVGSAAGRAVTTIEGLGGPDRWHPVQRAFADEGAAQCGYCTPGFVLSTAALLAATPEPDDAQVDAALAGHICRCGGYPRIRRAVHRAAVQPGAQGGYGNPPPNSPVDAAVHLSPGAQGTPHYRPERPWDLTAPTDRDWFGALGDGLVVVLEPSSEWTTARGAWLHINPSGAVTAFTGKVDVGQDNSTALRLLVAEELDVALASVGLVMGDTDVCPFDAGTFGSRSMPDAGQALRRTAAYARGLLPVRPGDRRIEIVTGSPTLSDPAGWRRAGHAHQPRAALDAVTGARRFVSDLALPDMAHGALLRPPLPGAVLRSLDTAVVDAWPDVTVIRHGELVGVVAADLVTARNAVAALAAHAEWDMPAAPSSDGLSDYLRAHPDEASGRPYVRQEGSAATALEVAAVRREATYAAAYIAPAALETRMALASWNDPSDSPVLPQARVTVWTGTQTPFPVRAQVAAALRIGEENVRIIVPPTGGAFGGKHAAGIAIEAAVLARHADKPVRVAWSRHEEFTAGTLRKASVIDVVAGATSDGQLSGWTFLNINSGPAGIATPYRVADQRLEHSPAHSPLPQGSYRGLAATANNFARESMIDELASELGVDLVKFRLDNLADERLADVLRAVAEHVGWASRKAEEPQPGEPAVGWGIACGLEKEGRVATAAQVAVWPGRDAGRVEVRRLVSGYECGAIVNPAAVRRQVEGAAVMALGGALFEAIEFTDGVITNAAFSRYPVPRIGDIPPVDVILLDRPDLPSQGAGETPMIAVAPAIAGAIFDATGQRLRSLPLDRSSPTAASSPLAGPG
ncbi:MAG TPA: molybdopterin cofactor-binding domain-containing protein [Streptosporangiaceae bacterium]|nr:molybdopterin cofactor-binding domain-containing protein [Streptosporangiaceae bacterium]